MTEVNSNCIDLNRTRNKAYHSLNRVRSAIKRMEYIIEQEAQDNAVNYFGWSIEDIERAFLKLQAKHFSHSKKHFTNPSIWVDHYRAKNLMGEDVYTHFHFEEEILVIQSLKRI